jgi:hypothetical protein
MFWFGIQTCTAYECMYLVSIEFGGR